MVGRLIKLLLILFVSQICYAGQITQCDMGTNGGLHPDVIFFPQGKSDGVANYKYWTVHTPLPECEEYPTVCVSNDGTTWSTPNGVTNPVVAQNTETSGPECEFDADPDWLWIDKWKKGLMVTGPETQISPRRNAIQLFYSSDLEAWTAYDGTVTYDNTNPTILYGGDSGGEAWEGTNNQYPALFFDENDFCGKGADKIWLYFGTTKAANNRDGMGCATFDYDPTTDDISNMQRCSIANGHGADNPVESFTGTSGYFDGGGHFDVSFDRGRQILHLTALRETSGGTLRIFHYTSSDCVTWANEELYMQENTSATHSCTGNEMYRSSYVHNGKSEMVFPEQIMYSMICTSGGHDYGIKGGTSFVSQFDGTVKNDNVTVQGVTF